jgi:tRNA(Ile)-lysidine synthase
VLAAEAADNCIPADPGQLALAAALEDHSACAVAVSGGSDSMALLRMAALLPGKTLYALTVDHGLRDGSRAEAEQVARWCAALSIPHHILTWQGAKPASGIQAKARVARYDLLSAWCLANGATVLLTAHTLNDQAETVAMRKERTASAASLAGIWPETEWNGVRVLRPLLGVTRCALRASLKRLGQGWLDDPSNENERFERVRIRRSLRSTDIALLGQEAAEAMARTRADRAAAGEWLQSHITLHQTGHITFPRAALAGQALDTVLLVLSRIVTACGGGRPERADVLRLAAELANGPAFRRSLGGALIAARSRDVLVGREPGRIAPTPLPLPLTLPPQGLLWDGRFLIHAPAGFSVRPALNLRQSLPHGPAQALPAFVREALPVLENAAGRLVFPHFAQEPGVRVQLGERFCL